MNDFPIPLTDLPIYAFSNLCQCPKDENKKCSKVGLFCYTDDPEVPWEPCFVSCRSKTHCTIEIDETNCIDPRKEVDLYLGLRNFTNDGFACSNWLPSSGIPARLLELGKK
ncbi:unnamed protein product [Soboliphyme baturini]|uniref:Uncharacterized protein n=1 Tax=Soboliphyme baturini TaxID=241478 RepID=A0A183J1B9_9BILA|nr:unnamed protein product [Soboliphyme baturini]